MLWLVAFLVLFIRELRAADKLERRIHGEALAIAYPLVLILLMTFALMELAVGLKSGTGRTCTSGSSYRSSI